MNFFDKIGAGITSTIDVIVEKNRQLAQLNRLAVIIKNEKAILEHAYVTLGKQYYKVLEKNEESVDTEQICEVIRFTEERLKKAQARYDYIKIFGMPVSFDGDVGVKHPTESACDTVEADKEPAAEEESEDITIAVADEPEKTEVEEKAETEENPEIKVEEETVKNKKQSHKKNKADVDTEAADDE